MAMFLVFVGVVGVWIDVSPVEIVSVQGFCFIGYGVGCLVRAWWGSAREAWRLDR